MGEKNTVIIGIYGILRRVRFLLNKNYEKSFRELSTNRIIFHDSIAKPGEFGHTGGSLCEK